MHEAAKQFLALNDETKRAACIQLCERALAVWEKLFPEGRCVTYQESVAGTSQTLDCGLPRDALASACAGMDTANVGQRYRDPLCALQDEDLALPDPAKFAYYAIHSAFEKYVAGRDLDEWVIVNQALASTNTNDPGSILSEVLREVV